MSHKTPTLKYETIVKKYSTGARIQAYKEHIGKRAKVEIIENETRTTD